MKDVIVMPGLRVSTYARRQALEQVQRLAREGLDVATFLSKAGVALDRVVPSDMDTLASPSWVTLDPASLLFTSTLGCDIPMEEVVEFEYASEMPGNRVGDVVRNPRGVQTARQLVDTDPGGAREYLDLLRSIGVAREALVALRDRDGEHWGAVYLVRGPGRPDFSPEELDFLRVIAPHLAEGIRRGLLLGEAAEPEGPEAPAIVVLGEDLTPESFTPGAQQWLSDLPVPERGELPAAVLSVAQMALTGRDKRGRGEPTSARVLSERRGWVTLHGQPLASNGERCVAVIIQPAGQDRITPLLMSAYGLTEGGRRRSRGTCCKGSPPPRSPRRCACRRTPCRST